MAAILEPWRPSWPPFCDVIGTITLPILIRCGCLFYIDTAPDAFLPQDLNVNVLHDLKRVTLYIFHSTNWLAPVFTQAGMFLHK